MKPTIIVRTYNPHKGALKEILAGIEEEGILYTLTQVEQVADAYTLAKEASKLSIFQVGIGLEEGQGVLCVHKTRDIILLDTDEKYRQLGQNGSRYIKGNPFVKNLQDRGGTV